MSKIRKTMNRLLIAALVGIVLWGCMPKAGFYVKDDKPTVQTYTPFDFSLDKVKIIGDIQPFMSEVKIDTINSNQYLIHLNLYTDFPSALPKFHVEIEYPRSNVHHLWSSRNWSTNSYITIPNYASLVSEYNVVSAISSTSDNRITLTAHDDFMGNYIGISVKQRPNTVIFNLDYFYDNAPDAEILEYKSTIFLDLREIQFSHVVRESAQWLLDKQPTKKVTKIEPDLLPVYSLWYPMHQNIPLENITYYFDSIYNMGFRSVLFDDGWQHVVRFDVDKQGNWDPSETHEVKEFMDKVKERDMKVALWYSLPMQGAHKYVQDRFWGKYLQYKTSSTPSLDIRYPDVREYLINVYSSVIENWGVDAVWFDFLNGYYPDEQIIITDDLGRDFVSVRKALDSLRVKLEYELLYTNPGLSINQSYKQVGPLHSSNTKSINGYLGVNAAAKVHEKLVNNRLMYGELSPFMEVMGVHPKDLAVDVARKYQAMLFGTPYVSFFSYVLPDELRNTLSFWISYWKENLHYLLMTNFEAYDPVKGYPVVEAGDEFKKIVVFYDYYKSFDLKTLDFTTADIINSSSSELIRLSGNPDGKVDYLKFNYLGQQIEKGSLSFRNNEVQVTIPIGGYMQLNVKK